MFLLKSLQDFLGKAKIAILLQLQNIFTDNLFELRALPAQIGLFNALVYVDLAVVREVTLLLLQFDEVPDDGARRGW